MVSRTKKRGKRTATGLLVFIQKWKEWFKVMVDAEDGTEPYSVFQSRSWETANAFMSVNYLFPSMGGGIDYKHIPERGQTIKHIKVYP